MVNYVIRHEQIELNLLLAHNNAGSNGDFTTSNLSYDLNGNIQSLNRRRGTGMMDQLDYDYSANKITKIEDLTTDTIDGSYGFRDSSDVTIEYNYDVNGNMSKDKNKGIYSIYYNHLNLPVRFVFNSGFEIHYEYDASGSKLSRKEIASDATQTKEYVYSGAFVYESPATLSFMSTGNGRLKVENNTVHEEYFIKDHLGNTRSTLRSAPTAQSFTYQQQNHYYAFGLSIEDLSSPISPENSNRITYNGKEFDKELNWYHYGARFYDPQVGRWWVSDVLDQTHSSYVYVANNPITLIDPDGRDIGFIISGKFAFFPKIPTFGNPVYAKASYMTLARSASGNEALRSIENDSKRLVLFAQTKTSSSIGAFVLHKGKNFDLNLNKKGEAVTLVLKVVLMIMVIQL